jgi:uncharacterized delta-60 repeat protein
MRKIAVVLTTSALLLSMGTVPGAQAAKRKPGDLDTGYSTAGTRSQTYWQSGDITTGVGVLSDNLDNAIIVATSTTEGPSQNPSGKWKVQFVKYGSNGTTGNFGNFGRSSRDFEQGSFANALTVQADDKVVAAGWVLQGSARRFLVTRSTTFDNLSGWTDYSFGGGPGKGGDGGSWTPVGTGNDAEAFAVKMTAAQKIVAAGRASNGSNDDFAIVRFNNNGVVDSGFGSATGVVTDFGGSNDIIRSLAVQPDGKYVAVGTSGSRVALARYQANGQLDPTFGGGTGKVLTTVGSSDEARGVAIQPDGKILVAGSTLQGGLRNVVLLRYLPSGGLDSSFGSGGRVVTSFSAANDAATAIALQPNGHILVSGYMDGQTTRGFLLARFSPNGAVDKTFGFSGSVFTTFGTKPAEATAMALQSDGKILLAGFAQLPSGVKTIATARYHNDQPVAQITVPGKKVKRAKFRRLAGSVTGANITHAKVAIQKLNPKLQRKGTCQWMMPAGFVVKSKAYAGKKKKMICEPASKHWADVKTWLVSNGVGYWTLPVRGFKRGKYEVSVRGVANKVNQETPTKKRVRVVK